MRLVELGFQGVFMMHSNSHSVACAVQCLEQAAIRTDPNGVAIPGCY